MSDTAIIQEPQPTIVTPAIGGDKPIESQLAHELTTALDKRESKQGAPPPQKQQAQKEPEQKLNGMAELRKSRDEAIEKIKSHESTIKERDTKLTELQTQLADFEGTRKERDDLKGRIESVEKERESLKKRESISALEESEEFQKKFVHDRGKHVDRLKELAVALDLTPDELIDASNKRGKDHITAMERILENVGRYSAEEIVSTMKAIQGLDTERSDQLARADEIMRTRLAERENENRQKAEQRTAARTKAWEAVAPALAKELGLTAEQVNEAHALYKGNRDAGKAAEITLKAHALDAVKNERDALKAELAKYQKATPGVKAGATEPPTGKRDYKAERAALVAEASEAAGWR